MNEDLAARMRRLSKQGTGGRHALAIALADQLASDLGPNVRIWFAHGLRAGLAGDELRKYAHNARERDGFLAGRALRDGVLPPPPPRSGLPDRCGTCGTSGSRHEGGRCPR